MPTAKKTAVQKSLTEIRDADSINVKIAIQLHFFQFQCNTVMPGASHEMDICYTLIKLIN